ncbi:MAG TPA: GAF domain-containing protein, partial [Gaiellaceae bacterium]|nr:GAF domain-containing protein [Gaiellaceae bacterium]
MNDRVESVRLAEEQAALRRVATLVAQGASPAEVFEAVVTEVGRQITGANAAALSRYETDDTLTMIGKWSRSGGYVPIHARYPLASGTVGSVIAESRRPGRVDVDAEGLRALPEVIRDLGWLSVVGAPIIVEGRLWGLVGISSTTDQSLPPDTEGRLAEFTELVATAIANAETRDGLRRLADEQAALRRVATLAARDSPPVEILEAVAEEAARVLEVDAIAMLRFEPDGTATLAAQSETPWDPPPLGTRFTLEGENIIASVHRTGQAARMDDWESATGSVAAMANVLGVRSTVASPIVVEGRLWGTMIAATNQSKPLPADTESRIVEFTELLATSIANAESREALSRLATEQAAL